MPWILEKDHRKWTNPWTIKDNVQFITKIMSHFPSNKKKIFFQLKFMTTKLKNNWKKIYQGFLHSEYLDLLFKITKTIKWNHRTIWKKNLSLILCICIQMCSLKWHCWPKVFYYVQTLNRNWGGLWLILTVFILRNVHRDKLMLEFEFFVILWFVIFAKIICLSDCWTIKGNKLQIFKPFTLLLNC